MKRPKFTLDMLNERARDGLPGYLGIRFTELHEGEVKAELDIKSHLLAANGYLHAGSIVALADTTAGFGCMVLLPDGANNFTTTELKSNHLSAVREGVITCTAKPAQMDRHNQVWDMVVALKSTGKTIALLRSTQMILYPK